MRRFTPPPNAKSVKSGVQPSGIRVVHTIAGLRADHGGTSRSVPVLVDTLLMQGIDAHLIAGIPAGKTSDSRPLANNCCSHFIAKSALFRQWGVPSQFSRALDARVRAADKPLLVHDHGMWLATNHAVSKWASRNHLPRIVSPRGMLSAWAMNHRRGKKKLAWWTYQKDDLEGATAFHATSKAEAKDIRSLGFLQPIAVIPNGINVPADLQQTTKPSRERQMLFLSRIHPMKGLLNLVHAWKLAEVAPEWRLIVAGPDAEGHQRNVAQTVAKLGIGDVVLFPGEITDEEKWSWYQRADVVVLPSFSENFGLVVAEALAAGTPVITTTATPWSELPAKNCGWQVSPSVGGLAGAIHEATTMSPETLQQRGKQGANWVRGHFRWQDIAAQMIEFYLWLLNGGKPPGFVEC